MKETEYKFLVDKELFYKILNMVKDRYTEADYKEKVQINFYYDTDDQSDDHDFWDDYDSGDTDCNSDW